VLGKWAVDRVQQGTHSILKLDRAEKAAPEEREPSEFSPEEEAA